MGFMDDIERTLNFLQSQMVSLPPSTMWLVFNPVDYQTLQRDLYEYTKMYPANAVIGSLMGHPTWTSEVVPTGTICLVPEELMHLYGGSEWAEYKSTQLKYRIESLLEYATTLDNIGRTKEAEDIRQYCNSIKSPQHIVAGNLFDIWKIS